MAGINRIISGELSKTKSKGSAFVSALASMFSPSAISKKSGKETQEVPSRDKKD